jgi:hypothetical protein
MPGMSGQELHAEVREWNRALSERFILRQAISSATRRTSF